MELVDPLLDHLLVADQDRIRNPFIHDHLAGAENLGLRAFEKDDTLGIPLGLVDDSPHDLLGPTQTALQTVLIAFPVGDGFLGHSGFNRRLGDGHGLPDEHSRIKGFRDDVGRAELDGLVAISFQHRIRDILFRQISQGVDCGDLHLVVDRRRPHIERAAEDERESQDVVYLIGEVGAARCHDEIVPDADGFVVHDLGFGVGHGEGDRIIGHALYHRLAYQAGRGYTGEDIGTPHHLR